MKTILITGGTNGLGKGIAMYYFKNGDRVIVVGNSSTNSDIFTNEAKKLGVKERAIYMQANLSLIKDNHQIIKEIKNRFASLDILIFCATKHNKEYTETAEGFELTFALDYLSRFILSYGLKEYLEKAKTPIIFNICGSGMKGEVNWSDLQNQKNFHAQKVMMHGSRLNDLSGVAFVQKDTIGKIKYILYNPFAVQTPAMMELYSNPFMKLIYKVIGKPVEKAIVPITKLLNHPPTLALSVYKEHKELDLTLKTYNKENVKKLFYMTTELLQKKL